MSLPLLKRYGAPNQFDRLKWFALTLMTIDHIGAYLLPDWHVLRAIGRGAVPLWLFVAGYHAASRPAGDFGWAKKNALPFLLYSGIFVGLDYLFSQPLLPITILPLIFFAHVVLVMPVTRRLLQREALTIAVYAVLALPSLFLVEYGTQTLLFAMIGYFVQQRRDDAITRIIALATGLLYVGIQNMFFDFNPLLELFVLCLGMTVVMWVLSFQEGPWNYTVSHPAFGRFACLLTRNSLHYYLLHHVLLQSLGYLLHPVPLFRLRLLY